MLASTYRSGSCVMRTEDNQKCNLANAVPWQLVSSVHSTRPEQERTDEMQAQECDLELRSESKRHQLNAFSLAKVVHVLTSDPIWGPTQGTRQAGVTTSV